MRAREGDWLLIKGSVVGTSDELGLITEVRGEGGAPPYVVRWLRDDHETLVFPGPDAVVLSAAEKAAADEQQRHRIEETQRLIVEQRSLRHSPVG